MFLFVFLEVFGFFFGILFVSLEVFWGGLWIQNYEKTHNFLRFLAMQLFGSMTLLMAIVGSSCYLFRCFGPKVGPIMVSHSGLEID